MLLTGATPCPVSTVVAESAWLLPLALPLLKLVVTVAEV
jgi:hypothetical protein